MEKFYPIVVALVFNGLDLLTGIITAIKNKNIKSSKLRDGLFKKVGFLICYFLALMVDTEGSLIGFQIATPILPIVILYACTTELVSILENISKINPKLLPEKLMDMFNVSNRKE